jgi:hypothetical protein
MEMSGSGSGGYFGGETHNMPENIENLARWLRPTEGTTEGPMFGLCLDRR